MARCTDTMWGPGEHLTCVSIVGGDWGHLAYWKTSCWLHINNLFVSKRKVSPFPRPGKGSKSVNNSCFKVHILKLKWYRDANGSCTRWRNTHVEHSILEKGYDLHVEWQDKTGCLELCIDNFSEKIKDQDCKWRRDFVSSYRWYSLCRWESLLCFYFTLRLYTFVMGWMLAVWLLSAASLWTRSYPWSEATEDFVYFFFNISSLQSVLSS